MPFSQNQSEGQNIIKILHQLHPELELTNIQETIFIQSWQGKTYQEIAKAIDYDPAYIKDVGHKLWKKLSILLEKPISKNNFYVILKCYLQEQPSTEYHQSGFLSSSEESDHSTDLKATTAHKDLPEVPTFCGYRSELSQLYEWVVNENNHLVGIFGLGGVGKTTLALKLVEQARDHFEHVLWRSLRDKPTFDELIIDLLNYFDRKTTINLPQYPDEQVSLLIKYLNQYRCLLVIDDWFTILCSHELVGNYEAAYRHYGLLLRRVSKGRHQSCVLITSRERPAGSAFTDNQVFPVRSLYLTGLSRPAGREALRGFGLSGETSALDQLLECYAGNPYALRVISKTIKDLFNGDLVEFLEQGEIIYGDIRSLLDQQFSRLSEAEKLTINYLACEPNEFSLETLRERIYALKSHPPLLEIIESLYNRSFVNKQGTGFRLHPLLKAYIVSQNPYQY